MKQIIVLSGLFMIISTGSAYASDEILQACISVVEVEGQAEGIAGCECLAEEVGDNQALIDELLVQAEKEPEERMLSEQALSVVGRCFALPDNTDEE